MTDSVQQSKIIRKIRLDPKYIDSNILDHLKVQLEKETETECNDSSGYILKVIEVTKIIDNYIENSSSDIIITVKCIVSYFRPKENMIVDALICAIYNDGLLVNAYDRQKILVPFKTYEEGDILGMKVGDTISVKITAVRYIDHKFSCLGVIV